MKKVLPVIISLFLLSSCSSDIAPADKNVNTKDQKEQGLKYEVREQAFDPAKTVEAPKKPASSLDQ